MEKNKKEQSEKKKKVRDAKGKASFEQNGEGNSPKYGQAGEDPSKTKEGAKVGKL